MRKYGLVIFLLFQLVLLQIIKSYPTFVDKYYSNFVYQKVSETSRIIFGKIGFSIGDCFYGILILSIIYWIFNKRNTWRINWKNNILSILNLLSVIYFAFHLLWGYNYYRIPLYEKMKIDINYSDADLLLFTKKMIFQTNKTHFLITKNKEKKVVVPYSRDKIFDLCVYGYSNLSVRFPAFKHNNQSSKKSLFSVPLSYMGFGGYLNPFTNEAQVNAEMPLYSFGMTATHEMAHQIGFASESECNFIGYLAAVSNQDLYIKYSAESFALRYCLRLLQIKNPKEYKVLQAEVNKGIIDNFKESDVFWKQHESFVETGFKVFYDNFLKVNQQKDGLAGYGKFLNLLIGFERL